MPAAAPAIAAAAAAKLAALGERIRSQRKTLKVSAVDAAEAAGISRVTLHRVEAGEPSVAMAAYIAAATAVGLELELVEPRGRSRGKPAAERPYPARIRLADYPQLAKLAWQLHGVKTLSPKEALGLYERNWRHVEPGKLEPAELALVNALVQHLGGGWLLV